MGEAVPGSLSGMRWEAGSMRRAGATDMRTAEAMATAKTLGQEEGCHWRDQVSL